MSEFWKRMRTIPRPAWIVGCSLVALISLALWLGPMRHEREMMAWPLIAKIALPLLASSCVLAYSLLVGFIYADAKRRRMKHVMWAWLALIPYFVGVILYFILRSPLPTPCPKCAVDVDQAFAFCPGCGAAVNPTCAGCGKSLQREWANCPYCGADV